MARPVPPRATQHPSKAKGPERSDDEQTHTPNTAEENPPLIAEDHIYWLRRTLQDLPFLEQVGEQVGHKSKKEDQAEQGPDALKYGVNTANLKN